MPSQVDKFTSGPWEVHYYPGSKQPWCIHLEGEDLSTKLCDIRGWGHLTGGGALNLAPEEALTMQTQVALKMAAAPEMLEVLIELGEAMQPRAELGECSEYEKELLRKASDIIAKATGKQ